MQLIAFFAIILVTIILIFFLDRVKSKVLSCASGTALSVLIDVIIANIKMLLTTINKKQFKKKFYRKNFLKSTSSVEKMSIPSMNFLNILKQR